MDKHMIHIDDLVRQRLDGAEEPEIPGGWLRMKELLDKEMPVQTGVGWGRRRVIGYFAGLLLMTTAGVGGYRYYMNHQPGIYVSGGAESFSDPSVTPEVLSLNMPSRDARSANANDNTGNSTVSNSIANISSANLSATRSNSNLASNSDNDQRHNSGQSTPNNQAPRNRSNNRVAAASGIASSMSSGNSNRNSENNTQSLTPQLLSTNVGTNNNAIPTSYTTTPQPSASEETILSTLPLQHLSHGSAHLLPSASSTARVTPTPLPVKFRFETIETIEIVHHRVYDANTQKNVFRTDTFPKGKVVVARQVPQPEMQLEPTLATNQTSAVSTPERNRKSTSKSKNVEASTTPAIASANPTPAESAAVPQSSAPSVAGKAEDGQNLETLASHKTSSKQFKLWDADKFNAAVNKFKFNLARIQVYPGVMGGINASIFTPNALGGFQLGLTSLVVLNDWWTLMGELKYLHRFNTGSTVHDDYMSVVPGSGSTSFVTINNKEYKAYEWKDQSVQHYFNFETVQTLEMPLALRYSWGRVYAMGGVNMMYSLPIKASEVTHMMGDTAVHRENRLAQHDDEKFIQDDAPLVKLSDFGPQFGLGYLIGGGFMFTPAVYMDLRVVQTFWSNAKTDGAKQISNDLLRTPSLQLSVGYRFAQKPR